MGGRLVLLRMFRVSQQRFKWRCYRRAGRFSVVKVNALDLFGNLFGNQGGGSKTTEGRTSPRVLTPSESDFVQPLLQSTFIANREIGVCYQMSVDGDSASAFHKRCDNAGPTLVAAFTNDRVVGGWFPTEFLSSDDYKESDSDFLFVAQGNTFARAADTVAIVEKTGGVGPVFDYARGGPQWGATPPGLVIGPPLSPVSGGITGLDAEDTALGTLRTAKSTLGKNGSQYAYTSNNEDSLFGDGVREVQLSDVVVFCAIDLYLLY